ncbi:alpha/beta hydrolase [Bacillus smithii]|uniref:alpha/beta hydrolase n=1 Tax=Bacillus smithii TaxID=1479 RepID=UPI002E1A918A|nr:alpha/beta hydrolase [Bacillus smithii]
MSQINNEFHIPINKEMSIEAQTIAKMLFTSSKESENINFSHPHSLEIFRRMMDKNLKELLNKITVDYQLERVSIDGIQAVWISTPQIQEDKKVILYLHGGCYVSGNTEIYTTIPIQLAHSSQINILSIDYSLAPEVPSRILCYVR